MKHTTTVMRVAVLLPVLLSPHRLFAMDVQQFSRMATGDQKDYLAFVVSEAKEVLNQAGEREQAEGVDQLFRDILKGTDRSTGAWQFERVLATSLHFVTTSPVQGMTRSVEAVFSQVLVNNGLKLTRNFTTALERATRNRVFHRQSD